MPLKSLTQNGLRMWVFFCHYKQMSETILGWLNNANVCFTKEFPENELSAKKYASLTFGTK